MLLFKHMEVIITNRKVLLVKGDQEEYPMTDGVPPSAKETG